jgi:hypothetical protein
MVIYIILTLAIARLASFLEQRAARSLSVHTRRLPRSTPSIRTAA